MELYELTHAIPANTAPEEVISRIAMDDSATDREKFMVQHVEEARSEVALKEDELLDKDVEIEDLEREKRSLTAKVAELERRVPDGTPIASNVSLGEVMRSILMDPKATNREKFLVKYFEARGGTWGWHQNL